MSKECKVIILCGSRKFKEEFTKIQEQLVLEGNVVISVGIFRCPKANLEKTSKSEGVLDDTHEWRIDMSDEMFVINKNGYIGESTKSEIEYALKIGKPIKYLEN